MSWGFLRRFTLAARARAGIALAAVAIVAGPITLAAQDADDPERRARLERQGAGLRVGVWQVRGLDEIADAEYAEWPHFEGYFQCGLDRHLVIESTVAVWRRRQEVERQGGIFGDRTREEVASYVVPMLTSLKFYPITGPGAGLEPFLLGGVGFAIGIDDRETTSDDLLGIGGGSGMAMQTGFGFKGGAGVEWRFSRALGLSAGARYQWIRFGGPVGGERLYRGIAVDGGLTYRFQYD